MTPTPFELDCNRKSQGLRDFQDKRLRRSVCGNCLVLRTFHFDSGCRWRRMSDREWKEYCGIGLAPWVTSKVIDVRPDVGGYNTLVLECGHNQVADSGKPAPAIVDCPRCTEEEESKKGKDKTMNWLNGRDKGNGGGGTTPAAGVRAPAPASQPAEIAPAVHHTGNGITGEVARFMPVMDIQQAVARRQVIVDAMRHLMLEGVDYGRIPRSDGKIHDEDRPMLFEPGADKLCNLFGLTLKYEFVEKEEDWSGAHHDGEPFFYYQIASRVYRGEFLLAEGVGSCCSWETKYRWRKSERTCPSCGKANIRKSRDGGWYCWKKTDGCGSVFNDGDPAIESQETGRKRNADVYDQVNTILKMAYKRAKISGTRNGTSASEFFSQDREDFTAPQDEDFTAPRDADTPPPPTNTRAAQLFVAQQKVETKDPRSRNVPWRTMREMAEQFKAMRERVGEAIWLEELDRYGWHSFTDLRNAIDNRAANAREKAVECYWHLDARKGVA